MMMSRFQKGRPLGTATAAALATLAAVAMTVAGAMGTWPTVSTQANAASMPGTAGVQVGRPAPAFAVPGLAGGQLAFAQYAGRPRIVTFFATSCGECLGDLAMLEPVYRRYRSRGLVVLGIGVADTAPNLRRAASQLGVSFPLGDDEHGDRVARVYGVSGIPTTIFVDADGIVRAVVHGSVRAATLQRNVALILARTAR